MQYSFNAPIILLHYICNLLIANSILKEVSCRMDKLVLSTNEVLYLQKQPLVGTLLKYVFCKALLFI